MNIEYRCDHPLKKSEFAHQIVHHGSIGGFRGYMATRLKLIESLGPCQETWNDGTLFDLTGKIVYDSDLKPNWLITDIVPFTMRFKTKNDAMIAKLLL